MDLHADVLAGPEGPAHAGEMEPDFLRGQPEAGRQLLQVGVEPLGGDEELDASVGGGHGETGLGTERRLVLHPGFIASLDPNVGGRIWITVDDLQGPDDVALGMHGWGIRLECSLHVGDGRQYLVVDINLLQRRPCQLRIFGGDDRHRLAGVAHRVDGEHWLVRDVEPEGFLARHIGVRQDGANPRRRDRGGNIDRHDARVGVRAAQCRSVQHPVAAEVAGVFELTPHLGHAIDPADGLADAALAADVNAHGLPPTPTLPHKGGGGFNRAFARLTSCPSRTTALPSTNRCRTGPGSQNTIAATGSASAPRCARSSTAKSAMSARLPTSIEPMSSRPRQAAPPRVATRSASRAVIDAAPLRANAADSRISSGDTEKGEQGPTAIRSIDPGAGSWKRWIARSVASRTVSISSTTLSGGRPPRDWPRSIDPRQGWNLIPSWAATSISASSRPITPAGKT